MTEEITTLDERTVSQIAAGEVVERPASVAKELLENSLDAGASRIDVSVTGGGADHLRVADDGVGMTEAGLRKAIRQHTTSKIRDIEDLEGHLTTLGFRGEALYTIGAVSRMTITTRPQEGPDVGTELRVVGGDVESVEPAGRAPGTTVDVEDLFFNKPARRKFLKTAATEFAHVNRIVTRYALANPDVAIALTHDGNEVFSTTGRDDLRETIYAVYGREVASSMVELDVDPGGRIDSIRGYVSDPETTRTASEYVSTFVNGRYVRAGLLRDAVVDAYGKQLAPDRFPFTVLFLSVPPDSVDVNVHPRKLDVRFDDERTVAQAVETAVREALLQHGLIRTSAPRGRSAPAETAVEPGGSSEKDDGGSDDRASKSDGLRGDRKSNTETSTAPETPGESTTSTETEATAGFETAADADRSAATNRDESGEYGSANADQPVWPQNPSKIRPQTEQSGLLDRSSSPDVSTLPPLRVLGQLQDTYIVAESPDGLVLVDQHAADERIAYERLAEKLADRTDSQTLVSPVRLEVTAQEASVFDAAESELAGLGFRARLEDDEIVVSAVPAVFSETLSPSLVRDLLSSFLSDPGRLDPVSSAADALLADMACYPAVTGNTPLKDGDVVGLLEALDACENPYACPHGRPVVIEVSEAELADRFERDYPGHGGRRQDDPPA
ncbi:MAG: DNA mismatch repair endonuclease MutL [Halanaeroarchaeum sp.]